MRLFAHQIRIDQLCAAAGLPFEHARNAWIDSLVAERLHFTRGGSHRLLELELRGTTAKRHIALRRHITQHRQRGLSQQVVELLKVTTAIAPHQRTRQLESRRDVIGKRIIRIAIHAIFREMDVLRLQIAVEERIAPIEAFRPADAHALPHGFAARTEKAPVVEFGNFLARLVNGFINVFRRDFRQCISPTLNTFRRSNMRQRHHGDRQLSHPEVWAARRHFWAAQFVTCVIHHAIDFFLQFRQTVEIEQHGARTGEARGRLAPFAMQNRIDDSAFFVHPIGGEFDDRLHHVQIIIAR